MHNVNLIGLGLAFGLGVSLSRMVPQQAAIAQTLTPTGLVIKLSPHSVEDTQRRFIRALESQGLTVFATIDHAQNAAAAGLDLSPTRIVLFGNPQAGTPLMQCQQSIGIDLPQKLLIFEDEQGVQIAYNDPRYLGGRHRLGGCGAQVIANVAAALNGLTEQAIAP